MKKLIALALMAILLIGCFAGCTGTKKLLVLAILLIPHVAPKIIANPKMPPIKLTGDFCIVITLMPSENCLKVSVVTMQKANETITPIINRCDLY